MANPALHKFPALFILIFILLAAGKKSFAQTSSQDTILTAAVIYKGDTIEAQTLDTVYFTAIYNEAQMTAKAKWNRLRNAVYVTFPYAKRAGVIINDINKHLDGITDHSTRKKYIQTREKELRKEFTEPLTNLSIYEGKILMKLINRETGNNCYDIIKDYKGGLTARVYQTVAFFFDEDLKQPYDPNGDDAEMEKIVIEVAHMYGYRS
jgi:hypothetical protein